MMWVAVVALRLTRMPASRLRLLRPHCPAAIGVLLGLPHPSAAAGYLRLPLATAV
jgi:hypothetical protein